MHELFQMRPKNMSVAVWGGYIALLGIASYLDQSFREQRTETRQQIRDATVTAGCSDAKKNDPKAGDDKPANVVKENPRAGDVHAGHGDHQSGEFEVELAKLSPEDHEAAEKQKTCPVSGEPLGSMGVPYKVEVKGRTVFLCCQGCEEQIKGDPDKYLAKLDKN